MNTQELQSKSEIVKQKREEAKQIAEQVGVVLTSLPYDHSFEIRTKNDHTVAKGIYAVSKPVKSYRQVKDLVERMTRWLNTNNGRFEPIKEAYAVSHCQVADDPLAFFVVSSELLQEYGLESRPITKACNKRNFYFPAQAIFNAEILETPETVRKNKPKREVVKDKEGKVSSRIVTEEGDVKNLISVPESCMSFPLRKPKNKERYHTIKVRYQIKGWFGMLRTKTEWVEGLKAHIFQHEVEHAQGKNMHYSN